MERRRGFVSSGWSMAVPGEGCGREVGVSGIAAQSRRVAKALLPPLVTRALGAARRRLQPEVPLAGFDPEGRELFRHSLAGVRRYAEYGMGASTRWVLGQPDTQVVAVDTAEAWVAQSREHLPDASRATLVHADLGPVGAWGRPQSYARRHAIPTYLDAPWEAVPWRPEVVLVDGRFRVACFLTSLLRADPGTTLLFDDWERPQYHVVEELLRPEEVRGRMARFTRPAEIDVEATAALRASFLHVMD